MLEHHDAQSNTKLTKLHPKEDIEKLGLTPTSWRIMEEGVLGFEYGKVSDLDQDQLLKPEDTKCFTEVRKVLKKYDALNRFGFILIDKNPLPKGKTWLETNNVLDRTLMMQVVAGKRNQNTIQTSW